MNRIYPHRLSAFEIGAGIVKDKAKQPMADRPHVQKLSYKAVVFPAASKGLVMLVLHKGGSHPSVRVVLKNTGQPQNAGLVKGHIRVGDDYMGGMVVLCGIADPQIVAGPIAAVAGSLYNRALLVLACPQIQPRQ